MSHEYSKGNVTLVLPDSNDPVDVSVLNNAFTGLYDWVFDLDSSTDRVTGKGSDTVDGWVWNYRSWSSGVTELWAVRSDAISKASQLEKEVTIPATLQVPYLIQANVTYNGPYDETSAGKNQFATKYQKLPPDIRVAPYHLQRNKFRIRIYNAADHLATIVTSVYIVGKPYVSAT